jgi:hypothetical protein
MGFKDAEHIDGDEYHWNLRELIHIRSYFEDKYECFSLVNKKDKF